MSYSFPSAVTIVTLDMFFVLYRRPFAPVGYYALGIMFSIFYFEYTQVSRNEDLKNRIPYKIMKYLTKSKKACLTTQLVGGAIGVFVLFIRYTSYGFIQNTQDIDSGTWPILLNAIFNAFAHYLFIIAFVLVFLPIFMGKLSIIRDIFASSFFRPLARLSFSALMVHSLMLFFIFFTHEQSIYYDHKNMMFIYFSLVFFSYITAVFIAMFLEYPFRTMGKVVFSPPKKILRLNKDLAKELNTNSYRAEYVESDLNDDSMMSEVNNSMQKAETRDMFDDIDEAAMMNSDDDIDNAHAGGGSSRLGSKKLGNLDLTLNIKENTSKLQSSEISEKEINFAKNINNSTFSQLMSGSNKKGN